jgi:hypothetical protein
MLRFTSVECFRRLFVRFETREGYPFGAFSSRLRPTGPALPPSYLPLPRGISHPQTGEMLQALDCRHNCKKTRNRISTYQLPWTGTCNMRHALPKALLLQVALSIHLVHCVNPFGRARALSLFLTSPPPPPPPTPAGAHTASLGRWKPELANAVQKLGGTRATCAGL